MNTEVLEAIRDRVVNPSEAAARGMAAEVLDLRQSTERLKAKILSPIDLVAFYLKGANAAAPRSTGDVIKVETKVFSSYDLERWNTSVTNQFLAYLVSLPKLAGATTFQFEVLSGDRISPNPDNSFFKVSILLQGVEAFDVPDFTYTLP